MSDEKRPYTKRRRAELEEETRRRIAASAMELHGSVGPTQTTISAVADRAGVRRSTLYRHFPDERSLFAACSAHFLSLHPPPDPGRWAAIADPDERLDAALVDLYRYFGENEAMYTNLLRDEPLVDAYDMADFRGFLGAIADLLMHGRPASERVRAVLGHAVAFTTWRSLAREQGLPDGEVIALMRRLVAAAADV